MVVRYIGSRPLWSSMMLLVLSNNVSHAWTTRGIRRHHRRSNLGISTIATTTIDIVIKPSQRKSSSLAACHEGGSSAAPASTATFTILESRRSFLTTTAAAITMTALVSPQLGLAPAAAAAATDDDKLLIDVYFGCGCFWHVQHEFVQAERNILQRSDDELTSRAGYAGGNNAGSSIDGKVCYHNAQNIADYGKLGHAEVVSLRIPTSKFEDFAKEYCKLFDKDGLRPDQFGDRGSEYRNLVGIPGGKSSALADVLVKASAATSGDKLAFAVGKGDDADVPKVSFIMDSNTFPFYVAENYHQFHDGFRLDENYSDSYNALAKKFAAKGESFGSCPNGMVGLGIGGL